MSSLEGSNGADFSFDGIGDFNFDDLIENVPKNENSGTELKIENYKKTEVFAEISDLASENRDHTDFFDAKIFSRRDKDSIPDGEKILAGLLLEKEGHKPVLMTRSGEAVILEQRAIRIHQEANDGTELVRTFDKREITIGSLSDEQYARIHSSAMTNLAFIARQQKEIDNEEKSGTKLKELASRLEINPKYKGERGKITNEIFQQQALIFSKNREAINRKMEFLFQEESISDERRDKDIEAKKDQREELTISQESKREVLVEERKSADEKPARGTSQFE